MSTETTRKRGPHRQKSPGGELRVVTSLSAFPQPLAQWKRLAEAEGISFSQWASRAMEQYAQQQAG